ncbi:MAG: hypothetical protein AAGK05_11580 [Pseudomonadota bacterium]
MKYNSESNTQKTVFGKRGEGFKNWKKAIEKFSDNEKSDIHLRACEDRTRYEKKLDVHTQMKAGNERTMSLRREGLVAHLQTYKTLLRQEVPIRRIDESESNIHQFNKDKAIHVPGLKLLLQEKKYMSHDILQEQEELIVLTIRRQLVQKIQSNTFFSIIADETSDISKTEQISFSIRNVNDSYEIEEAFLGIRPCDHGLTAEALLNYIGDILIRCGLRKENLVGLGFDGPSVMKKLAKLVKQHLNSNVLYVHCLAHCTELAIHDACETSPILSSALDICQDIYAFVGAFPKRVALFENIQCDSGYEKLKSLSQTRWTTRGPAVGVIIRKRKELITTLGELDADKTSKADARAKAHALKSKLESTNVLFSLVVTYEVMIILEKLSQELQSVNITAELAHYSMELLKERLKSMGHEDEFKNILKKCELFHEEKETKAETIAEPARKRKKPVPYFSDYKAHLKSLYLLKKQQCAL